MSQLRVRKPSGQVAWPMVLVEGAEKVGKTYTALSLSASERVGRTFVFDLGEGTADEYAALGPYEVVDHDGTFAGFVEQLRLAAAVPMVDGKPNVIVVDSVTVLWETIKAWADARARRGTKARKALAQDPDADVSIPMNIWTDAADRWGQMIHVLRYAPVVSVLIARGKEVALVDAGGQPVTGKTDYKIEAHKSLPAQVTALVRVEAPGKVRLTGVRSLAVQVPTRGLSLPEPNPLEHLVFDVMGAGRVFGTSSAPEMQAEDRTHVWAKRTLLELVQGDRDLAKAAWESAVPAGEMVTDAEWDALLAAVADHATPEELPDAPLPDGAASQLRHAAEEAAEWAERDGAS